MRAFFGAAVVAMFVLSAGSVPAEDRPKPTEAEKAAIAKIREAGGQVMEVAQNDNHLEVAYHLADGTVTNDHLAPLKELKGRIVSLNLRGTAVTDEGLANLEGLTGLQRLHLEKTKITDKGLLHLKGLTGLEYLNLYGTEVTDAGLEQLAGLKNLKKLYLWQTKVTDAGVEKLKGALPQTTVIRGLDALPVAEPKPEEKKADEKKADKKPEDKKPEEKKEEKKAEEKKAEDKKAEEKKSDEKKPDDKKEPEKKSEKK